MGSNIPKWTKEVLGQPMTIQQFLSNPRAQDIVAETKLSQYYNERGNHADAAAMWFSGKPYLGNNRRDVNINTKEYVRRAAEAYNKLAGNI